MRKIILGIALFSIIVSGVLYTFLGDALGVLHYSQRRTYQKQIAIALKKNHNPQQVINQLEQHLKKDPTSAKGWYLLGSLYSDLREYSKAQAALLKAHQLKPDNLLYAASRIEVNYFKQKGRLTDKDKEKLGAILKKQPDNVVALNLMAFDAYHRHAYDKAVMFWRHLLNVFAADSQEHQLLLKMITKAQKEEFNDKES